jgi:5-methylcytosine-specific restriction endonuclease McrA|tara:strand:- start:12692 stop:13174 length:483 start_codon:yes stop_codon:yes gene_type:complete
MPKGVYRRIKGILVGKTGKYTRTEETKRKMRARKHPEEIKRKISSSLKGNRSPLWRGGKTEEHTLIRQGIETRLWRESVFSRDSWECQRCGQWGGKLNAHHIKNFSQWPELRFAIDNGITLCKDCHRLFHNEYGYRNNTREQMSLYLKAKVRKKKVISYV